MQELEDVLDDNQDMSAISTELLRCGHAGAGGYLG